MASGDRLAPGYAREPRLVSGETRPAASPTTSTRRVSASWSIRLEWISSRLRPETRARASLACSTMCRIGTVSSRCDIQVSSLGQHPIAQVGAQAAGNMNVRTPPEQRGQGVLDAGEREERDLCPGLELHEDVDVARFGEVVTQDGPEERQSSDPMSPTQPVQIVGGDADGTRAQHGTMLGSSHLRFNLPAAPAPARESATMW
jgi:hypothetical protein